jgi:GT2 family glycosyltransferase
MEENLAPATDLVAVSVIVPYFDSGVDRLDACLDALRAQEGAGAGAELIVVDNSPNFDLRGRFSSTEPLQLLHEPKPGSYAARNRGIRASRGAVLAFTDADCVPDRNWLARGLAALEKDRALDCVGGGIVVTFRRPNAPGILELCDSLFYLRQENYVKDDHYAATANLLARRSVFETVGLFREERFTAGDREWGVRMWSAGHAQAFCPDAAVYHPARSTLRALLKKTRRSGGGSMDASRPTSALFADVWQEGKSRFRRVRRNKTRFGRWRIYPAFLLIVGMQTATFLEVLRLKSGGRPQR